MIGNGQLGVRSKEEERPVTSTPVSTLIAGSVGTLLAVAVVGFLVAAPFTWLLMLFLGNLGLVDMGFWECLPGGGLVGALVAGRVKS